MSRGTLAWLTCLGSLTGCLAAGIPPAEIPERAIAIRYYDVEAARKRAEALAEPTPAASPGAAVARVEDISSYARHLLGVRSQQEPIDRRFPGRMALLDPRTEEVTPLRGALKGAVPRSWSPDGEWLLFSQVVGRYRQLFELNRTTGEVRPVTHPPAVHADGCYGPAGRYVILTTRVLEAGPSSYLEMTTPGGGRPSRYSEGPADYAPACAPDGNAVVWVSVDERGRDVLMSRAPALGGETRRLGPGRDPAFSPDSEWVVYSAQAQGRWRLFRIRPDGSGRRAVGEGSYDEFDPVFSPDGRLVAYVSDDGAAQRLYLRRFDGSGDRVLLESGSALSPAW